MNIGDYTGAPVFTAIIILTTELQIYGFSEIREMENRKIKMISMLMKK